MIPPESCLTLVLVDDHLVYRQSLRLALESLGGFQVVGQAATARDAYAIIAEQHPDLTVIDFMLPDTDALSMIRELRRRRIHTRSFILSRLAHPTFVQEAVQLEVDGFALKRQPLDSLRAALRQAAAGQRYLAPELQAQLDQPAREVGGLHQLSAREREIFCRLVDGLSTKEIARTLYLSPKTVDAHRLHINRKLGIRSPVQLARIAAESGLLAL
jgi:DNA-binding NarL/FixJ family response regulator